MLTENHERAAKRRESEKEQLCRRRQADIDEMMADLWLLGENVLPVLAQRAFDSCRFAACGRLAAATLNRSVPPHSEADRWVALHEGDDWDALDLSPPRVVGMTPRFPYTRVCGISETRWRRSATQAGYLGASVPAYFVVGVIPPGDEHIEPTGLERANRAGSVLFTTEESARNFAAVDAAEILLTPLDRLAARFGGLGNVPVGMIFDMSDSSPNFDFFDDPRSPCAGFQ